MRVQLSSDQEFFRDTTAKFLAGQVPVAELRNLRFDPAGFDADYWRRGAELGWTSLLVDEAHGGGSISDDGLLDLTLIAYEFGRRAAPGPLVPVNVVAGTLAATGTHPPVLDELLAGTSVAAWAVAEAAPHDHPGEVDFEIRLDGDEFVLSGVKRPVEAVCHADQILVTGRTGSGLTQVLVPASAPGLSVIPMNSADLTRRFGVATFDEVRVPRSALVGEVGAAGSDVDRQYQQTLVMIIAESVGAMQQAFDLTVEWAFDRYSFGRPLASYQALKHRFAEMKACVEAGHAIGDEAAAAVAAGDPLADDLLSAAKAFIGDRGSDLLQDCVQLHGGIGVTFEHDLHLFLRRHTVNRALHGTPADHRQRLTNLIEQRRALA